MDIISFLFWKLPQRVAVAWGALVALSLPVLLAGPLYMQGDLDRALYRFSLFFRLSVTDFHFAVGVPCGLLVFAMIVWAVRNRTIPALLMATAVGLPAAAFFVFSLTHR